MMFSHHSLLYCHHISTKVDCIPPSAESTYSTHSLYFHIFTLILFYHIVSKSQFTAPRWHITQVLCKGCIRLIDCNSVRIFNNLHIPFKPLQITFPPDSQNVQWHLQHSSEFLFLKNTKAIDSCLAKKWLHVFFYNIYKITTLCSK